MFLSVQCRLLLCLQPPNNHLSCTTQAYASQGRLDDAVKACETALEVYPPSLDGASNLVWVWELMRVGGASALVTFSCVLCTLRSQI
jgi:hypothetical protein